MAAGLLGGVAAVGGFRAIAGGGGGGGGVFGKGAAATGGGDSSAIPVVLTAANLEKTKAVEANVSDAEKNCRDALYRVMLRNVEEHMQREPSSQFNKYLMPNHAPTKAFFGPISELAGASGVRSLMHEACRSAYVCDLLCTMHVEEEPGKPNRIAHDPLGDTYERVEKIVKHKIDAAREQKVKEEQEQKKQQEAAALQEQRRLEEEYRRQIENERRALEEEKKRQEEAAAAQAEAALSFPAASSDCAISSVDAVMFVLADAVNQDDHDYWDDECAIEEF